MDILEVSDLRKSFKKSEIIKGISFSVAEGEILGILGPNGAGKTTTLQMILGILTPTSGSVRVFCIRPDKPTKAERTTEFFCRSPRMMNSTYPCPDRNTRSAS